MEKINKLIDHILFFLSGIVFALVIVSLIGNTSKVSTEGVSWDMITTDYIEYCNYSEIKGFIGHETQPGLFVIKQNFDTLNIQIKQ